MRTLLSKKKFRLPEYGKITYIPKFSPIFKTNSLVLDASMTSEEKLTSFNNLSEIPFSIDKFQGKKITEDRA